MARWARTFTIPRVMPSTSAVSATESPSNFTLEGLAPAGRQQGEVTPRLGFHAPPMERLLCDGPVAGFLGIANVMSAQLFARRGGRDR